ncbi:MAG: lamin tail domain-containing protein [Flavobacteriales bacterium]|nr:lamin tail domain-containing protein [Flavobacteriales bacterium]
MSAHLCRFFGCLLVLIPSWSFGQFSDDFSDGDFTANPTWGGETTNFEVDGNQKLHLNAPVQSDTSYLSVASQAIDDASWEFSVGLEFNPSSSNLARVYLVSNNANLRGNLNGYFVRIGGETEDRISLYRQDGSSTIQLITSTDGLVNTDPVNSRIKVTRNANSDWELFVDTSGGTSFVSLGTANDTTYFQSLYAGVYCKYTSTRSDKFYFDDFNVTGTPFIDSEAPTITSLSVLSASEIDILFSEPINVSSAQNSANYLADGGLGSPTSAVMDGVNSAIVHLTFGSSFTNGTTYGLTVSNIQDLSGNTIITITESFVYVIPSPAGFRDVVINEFMCDPTPFVGLADAEYVELFNASSNYIDLAGWKLGDATGFGTVGPHIIGPGDYALLVASASAPLFAFYPNVVLVTSFPSLNNTGDDIILQDANEITIDQIQYDLSWYRDPNKEDGGYSLEQINPFAACSNPSNWSGSEHPLGGTPATQNSVFDDTPDTVGPSLLSIGILGAQSLQLNFNEALNSGGISAANIHIEPSINVTAGSAIAPSNSAILVTLSAPIDTGVVYTLTVSGIADCEGNIQEADSVETFLLPYNANSGDFVINEVLFNPYTGGSDYVEIVNVTDRPLNLRGWLLASFDTEDGISGHRIITQENYAVEPGGFVLITEDTTDVMTNYIQHGLNNFIEADMPSYNNDSGTVYLLNIDSIVSESFSYTEEMHFPLLSSVDGVSLERLDVNRPVNDMGNWHSAAQTVGFGTPGLENSQYYPTSGADGEVSMDPEIFSPDNDGYNDVLNINYSFTSPGFVGTIHIYDSNGRPTRKLASNELLATSGTFTWDGTTDKGEKARIGMYVILFEAFSTSGNSNTYKLSTVLGGKL